MPTTEFFAHSDGAKLACQRRGRGAPILLIMGVAGHHLMWREQFLARLAEHFEVITFDHRGIGDSSPTEAFTLADLTADAVAVLDWGGVSDAHVVGISMGGAVAQLVALDHPDRVRTLSLVATWPDDQDVWGEGVVKIAAAARTEDRDTAQWLMFEANVSASYAADESNFAPFRDTVAKVKVPGAVIVLQMAAAAKHDVIRRLPTLDVPTLVVHGTQDEIIKASAGERIAGVVPGARLELWPGLGHLLCWEAPTKLADAVRKHAKAPA